MLFEDKEAEEMVDNLLKSIAYTFKKIDSINFIYDTSIEEINNTLHYIVGLICKNISSYKEWLEHNEIYIEYFQVKILSIFEHKIEIAKVKKRFLEKAKQASSIIEISEDILGYTHELESLSLIEAEQALKLFKL